MTSPITYLYLTCFVAAVIATALFAVLTPAQPAKRRLVFVIAYTALWSLGDFLSNMAGSAAEVRALTWIFCFVWAPLPYMMLRAALLRGPSCRADLHSIRVGGKISHRVIRAPSRPGCETIAAGGRA